MLAAILESGEPSRLYTALSLLVSTAADGEPARGLVSFGALVPMLSDPDPAGEDAFTRTLAELRRTAAELDDCRLWACAAAVETVGVARADVVEDTCRRSPISRKQRWLGRNRSMRNSASVRVP